MGFDQTSVPSNSHSGSSANRDAFMPWTSDPSFMLFVTIRVLSLTTARAAARPMRNEATRSAARRTFIVRSLSAFGEKKCKSATFEQLLEWKPPPAKKCRAGRSGAKKMTK